MNSIPTKGPKEQYTIDYVQSCIPVSIAQAGVYYQMTKLIAYNSTILQSDGVYLSIRELVTRFCISRNTLAQHILILQDLDYLRKIRCAHSHVIMLNPLNIWRGHIIGRSEAIKVYMDQVL